MSDVNNYKDLIQKAREYGANEKWDECISCYEDAFCYYENEILIGDLLDLALAYVENNNQLKGYNIIQDIINNYEDSYIGYHYLGYYYLKLKDDKLALESFLNSEKLGDNSIECLFNIGLLYDDSKDFEKAINYYLKVLEIDKDNFYANLNLGAIYQEQNKLQEALEIASRIKELYPQMHLVNYNLGVVYGLLGDYEKAKECYLEELTKDNYCTDAYFNLAIIYKDFYNDYNKSKELYLKGLEDNKNDSRYWYNLACIHCLLKDYKNACDCFYCSYLINNKVIKYLNSDEEATEFKKSEYYNKLLNLCK